jgi:hypothetical protein
MGVSPKTENEEYAGKTMQIRGSEGGRRGFTGTCLQDCRWRVPRQPSARLTYGLKLDTAMWLLRCSVFGETPMASAIHFKKLNCYEERVIVDPTLLRTKASGNASSNRWIAFQPVQCMGTTNLGSMAFKASMVSPMMGSKKGPER